MNAINPDHNVDPIADALHRAAAELTLRRGSHVAVVRRATRRQHRRRRAVAAGAVIAVGGGTVLTIQQLTRPTGGTLRSPADEGTEVGDVTPDATATVGTTSPPNAAAGADPAVLVESDLVWNVVTPDTASSVGFSYGPIVLPGMVVSSAPGRTATGAGMPVVWRSEDGITWEQLDVELPVGSLTDATAFDGDRIYTVGTAPGVAASFPNPLLVASSDDAGSTWNTITLPIDSNASASLPFVRRAYAIGRATPITGGVLVAVNSVVELDTERLDLGNFYSWNADGVETQADPNCQPDDQPSGIGVATTIVYYGTPNTEAAEPRDVGGCEVVTRPWSDYGVPPETVAAMFDQPSRVFRITDDGTTTEIDGPSAKFNLTPAAATQGPNPIFFATDSMGRATGWYRYLDDGTWQELDVPAGVYDVRSAGEGVVGTVSDGHSTQVAMSRDGTNWTRADLAGLYAEPMLLSTWPAATAESGAVTMAVSSTPDAIAAQGGAEITIGGVTARVDRAGAQVTIIDEATGEPIDPALITDTSAGVSVADGAGGVRALFPMESLLSNLLTSPAGQTPRWDVVRTTDGVSFSRESVADLLGMTDADISSIAHISTYGSKVVVGVTLTERDDDGIRKQLVLVGTPRG
jgi:hypothetical protein